MFCNHGVGSSILPRSTTYPIEPAQLKGRLDYHPRVTLSTWVRAMWSLSRHGFRVATNTSIFVQSYRNIKQPIARTLAAKSLLEMGSKILTVITLGTWRFI
jgi:hypothetical protein